MKFTKRVNRVGLSLTIGMAQKSRELAATGVDVISLSLGEPDFDTPQHIKDAAVRALDQGRTKYTPVSGLPELKNAICQKLKRDNNLDYSPENILVSTGAKQAIMNIVLSLVQDGDEVIIPLPYWVSYGEMVNYAGGKNVFIKSDFKQDFRLDLDQLESSINPNTRLIIFSSPCNPSGAAISDEDLERLAVIIEKNPHVSVISDEIYEHIRYSGKHKSLASFAPIKDQVFIINGVSKAFAMTGWRIGYMVAPPELIKVCNKLQGQFTSGANSIAQLAAAEALTGSMEPSKKMVSAFEQRRNLVFDLFKELPGFEVNLPKGAFYLFPKVSQLYGKTIRGVEIKSSMDLCEMLLQEAHVSMVPGVAFGMDDHVRLSYASSEENLKEAAKRISAVLSDGH